eukprot:CAMPEP_0170848786 /NCGR_PEP_ID=MMETSP0734-20130129/9599_1 /TAXON_ID=186038 /ORGANISM="Fragilariopsis kerguelensis, Strain L26-C5" /LENGTH=92 /DNA_ID=CAMNT_0011218289 /DNA_START=819 /DNA_END=1097 /DNA_ORIENTATION=-
MKSSYHPCISASVSTDSTTLDQPTSSVPSPIFSADENLVLELAECNYGSSTTTTTITGNNVVDNPSMPSSPTIPAPSPPPQLPEIGMGIGRY